MRFHRSKAIEIRIFLFLAEENEFLYLRQAILSSSLARLFTPLISHLFTAFSLFSTNYESEESGHILQHQATKIISKGSIFYNGFELTNGTLHTILE